MRGKQRSAPTTNGCTTHTPLRPAVLTPPAAAAEPVTPPYIDVQGLRPAADSPLAAKVCGHPITPDACLPISSSSNPWQALDSSLWSPFGLTSFDDDGEEGEDWAASLGGPGSVARVLEAAIVELHGLTLAAAQVRPGSPGDVSRGCKGSVLLACASMTGVVFSKWYYLRTST